MRNQETVMPWIVEALKHNGLREIPGKEHCPTIQRWTAELKGWWSDDETPWCGTFVAHCLRSTGFEVPKLWMRAKAWAEWGTPLVRPAPCCIVVFMRDGGGHVGFVLGEDAAGNLMVLGGNQGNRVSIAPFARARVLAYRCPPGQILPATALARMSSDGKLSTNEA